MRYSWLIFCTLIGLAHALPAQQGERLRVSSRLVYVDAVVRDAHGQPVMGLTADQFLVKEDGRPEQLAYFAPPTAVVARKQQVKRTLHFSNVPEDAAGDGAVALLFDLADTPLLQQPYARQQMIAFLQQLPAGHRLALFVLSDQLYEVQGFTGDSATLVAAAKLITPKELNRVESQGQRMAVMERLGRIAEGGDRGEAALLANAVLAGLDQENIQNTKVRSQLIAGAFRQIAVAMTGVQGRKSLFWLAAEFPLGLTEQLRYVSRNPGIGGARQLADTAVTVPRAVGGALGDAQVAVYPISVAGVETDLIGPEYAGVGTAVAAKTGTSLADQHVTDSFERRQDVRQVMNDIAQATGGRALYGSNDLSEALSQALDDGSGNYTLAFRPDDDDKKPAMHQISVNLRNLHGYTLTYRHSYRSPSQEPPRAAGKPVPTLLQAMTGDVADSTALQLAADLQMPAKDHQDLVVNGTLATSGIGFATADDGMHEAEIVVLLEAFRKKSAQDQKQIAPKASGTLHLRLTDAQLRALQAEGIHFQLRLPLMPGEWIVKLGAVQTESQTLGTLHFQCVVP